MRVALDKLFNGLLQQGVDFDRIPGTDKPTLLKPGAELLCQVFRLAPGEPKVINATEDFEKGILSYILMIRILHRDTGMPVAAGIGSANSYEIKYKYRNIEQDGEKIKILNPEPADQQNTLIKMAAKRAYIDGVLKATGASRMFTQDVEDMPWLTPEKASSKQISYIKSLYKGTKDEIALAEISTMIGREIKAWDDVSRNEATKIIDMKKNAQQQSKAGEKTISKTEKAEVTYLCSQCKAKITQAAATYSEKNFGRYLCVSCQKKVQKESSQADIAPADDPDLPWDKAHS